MNKLRRERGLGLVAKVQIGLTSKSNLYWREYFSGSCKTFVCYEPHDVSKLEGMDDYSTKIALR